MRRDKNGAIYLNIRGLYPLRNRTKVCYLRDLAAESNCSMIVVTETHLTPSILDAEVSIPGYILYRSDRDSRTHGGCAIYVREDLTSSLETNHSNSVCETLAVKIKTLNTLVVAQYRPPDCQLDEYIEALAVSQQAIEKTMKNDCKVRTILKFGDFNFPFLKWPSRKIYSTNERAVKSDEKLQAEKFNEFCDETFLENYVTTPTRGRNILDLILSNNHMLINFYKMIINKTLSDHNLIYISLNFSFNEETRSEKVMNPYSTKVFQYETKKATIQQWGRFDHVLRNIDEEELLKNIAPEEQLKRIYQTIEEALEQCLEKKESLENDDGKVKRKKIFIPRRIRSLMRRKEKLSERVLKSRSWLKNHKVMEELEEIECEIDESYKKKRMEEETKARLKLKDNPAFFYTYTKKFSKTNSQLNTLVTKDGSVLTDPLEQAELLMKQYESVYSRPKEEFKIEDAEEFFKTAWQKEQERLMAQEQKQQKRLRAQAQMEQDLLVSHCRMCADEKVHIFAGDQLTEDEDDEDTDLEDAADDDIPYLSGLEPFVSQAPPGGQCTMGNHPKPLELDSLQFHWQDFSDAIDSIPAGASCGPDGVPAALLKMAKTPLSRMLAILFKTSVDRGSIPAILKLAHIIPIHKGGSRGEPANYRPISLTSHIMKTGERVMRKAIINFLEFHGKMDPKQHGSRSGRSTLSQLLQHQDEIIDALENGDNIDSIYLDFSKAYDKVDHGILLHKLKSLGITGKLGRWIMMFISGRRQVVLVKGRASKSSVLISGVPQGSVLGPLLFLVFIGDLADGVEASVLIYVDDSKVKKAVKNENEVEALQIELDKIYKWEENNNMKFNGGKFQILRYGQNKELKEDTVYFTSDMENVIEQVSTTKDLGITMTDDAKFEEQTEKVSKKARQKSGWILRTFYSRNTKFMRHMFNTLVQPHIDYCSQLWAPTEGAQMQKIEDVLRNFTSKIPSLKHMNYWERLKELKMNSMQRRLERYKMIYTWKVIEGLVPNCGIEAAEVQEEPDETRKGRLIKVPKHKSKVQSIQKIRETSFQMSGPKLFNQLPRELRDLTKMGVEEFKQELDKFLQKIPDQPKCPGLTPVAMTPDSVHSNSLLHQVAWARREGMLRG